MSFTDYYNSLKENINNISYWYPKIKDCGMLIPDTHIVQVPEDIVKSFFMDNAEDDMSNVYEWVKNSLMPSLPNNLKGLIFMKNGAFSNKFDFKTCCIRANPLEIASNLIDINYTSLMFDTAGNTEVAIREVIYSDTKEIPCIYNGMPLRNEYRIFYDFTNKKPLYIVNYWDWDYCYDSISRNATDKIIYESVYPKLLKHYEENKDRVIQTVSEHMKNVDLEGIWSVDILEDENDLWLIDMAIGYRSAYWDPSKVDNIN